MFRPTLANPAQKRTLRVLYGHTQATSYGGFLDPDWDRSFDILPGTVMVRTTGELFTPATGDNGVPFGLSALWCAPSLGIDEVTGTGTNLFTVWVGDTQAVFEILAPAFDPDADWAGAGSGAALTTNSTGLLTPALADEDVVAELMDVISPDKIQIRLREPSGFSPVVTTS